MQMHPDRQKNDEIFENLRKEYSDALRDALKGHTQCTLCLFPDQWNVGDSAIWLGQKKFLHSLGITSTLEMCTAAYSPERISRRPAKEPILLTGGGNMGDNWPNEENNRLKILSDFPNKHIIQLPQSIHYNDLSNPEKALALYQRDNFTLMVRDWESQQKAMDYWGKETHLVPDGALGLDALTFEYAPEFDILFLCRDDPESQHHSVPDGLTVSLFTTDWMDLQGPRIEVTHNEMYSSYHYADWLRESESFNRFQFWKNRKRERTLIENLARARLQRGLRILSLGRVVITDRLHAHILCTLAGKPNILIDNNYGKNSAYYHAWNEPLTGCHFTESPEEAFTLAETILSQKKA